MRALVAAHTHETVGQDSTTKKRLEIGANEGGKAVTNRAPLRFGVERPPVVLDGLVEQRFLGMTALVPER
jgi:hypothetical protein